MSSIRTETMLL